MTVTKHVIASMDGTPIAVWGRGGGRPVLLVHGSMTDHTYLDGLATALADSMAVYSVDRRGRGASGDNPEYDIMREFEDVAVVVNDVARREGEAPVVFGHSYGAAVALGGAALTRSISHLVLYEPSLGISYPPGSISAIERAVADGDEDLALSLVYKELLQVSDDELAEVRAGEQWESQTRIARTVAREVRAEESWQYKSSQFDGIAAPVVLITGETSPSDLKEAMAAAREALPGSQVTTLEGHGHSACRNDPGLVAGIIERLVSGAA